MATDGNAVVSPEGAAQAVSTPPVINTAGMTVTTTGSTTQVNLPVEGAQIAAPGQQGVVYTDPSTGQTYTLVPTTTAAQNAPQAAPAADPNQTPNQQQNSPQAGTESTQQVQAGFQEGLQQQQTVAQDLQSKGIDFNALSAEFDQNGELSAQSLSSLEKAGYPKAMVDAYVQGMQAKADAFVASVKGLAGGEEGWNQIAQFAAQDEQLKATINRAVEVGDLGQLGLIIEGVQARIAAQYGTANPTLMGGGAGTQSTPAAFTSNEEMVKAMQDPRYQKDAQYTQEVYSKIKNSTLF